MENLIIEASKDTPYIFLEYEKNILEINGKSYPPSIRNFYVPVIAQIKSHIDTLQDTTFTVNIHLIYFNSSTAQTLVDLLFMLEEAAIQGKKIIVNWIYDEGDDDNLEYGEDFREDFKTLTFNLVKKDDQN